MWDIREPADFIDGEETRRIAVSAGVRRVLIPYLREWSDWDPVVFENVLFERDSMPGPDGYAVYRSVG